MAMQVFLIAVLVVALLFLMYKHCKKETFTVDPTSKNIPSYDKYYFREPEENIRLNKKASSEKVDDVLKSLRDESTDNVPQLDFNKDPGKFTDYMKNSQLSPDIIKQHMENVDQRIKSSYKPQNLMTLVYKDDPETEQTNWQGFRRPRNVPIRGIMASIPDVNYEWYSDKSTMDWMTNN